MGLASSFCYIDFSSGYKKCPKTYYKESFNYSIFYCFMAPFSLVNMFVKSYFLDYFIAF